jgi:hypothetical protein
VTCRPNALGVGPNVAAALLDVSEHGARLLLTAGLAPGRAVEVGLEGPGHGRPLALPARVVWCVPAADGHYVTGLRFDEPLAYADLHQLAHL